VAGLNHALDPELIFEGQTILLPAGALSARDREILSGIGPGTHRLYPVRRGDTPRSILEPRKVTVAEAVALNPEAEKSLSDADAPLEEGLVLKLPAGRYTVREREMLIGASGAPAAFFSPERGPVALSGLVGAALGAVAAYLYLSRTLGDQD